MDNASSDSPQTWLPARPTVYNGVRMRSRLEAGFAQWADSMGLGVDYEPHAFASDAGQYLPDFLLRYVTVEGIPDRPPMDATVWVEIKPRFPSLDVFERMEIIRGSDPAAVLAVVFRDPAPGLWVSRPGRHWREGRWTDGHSPYNVGIGVAEPLERDVQPWPDGYWKGQG